MCVLGVHEQARFGLCIFLGLGFAYSGAGHDAMKLQGPADIGSPFKAVWMPLQPREQVHATCLGFEALAIQMSGDLGILTVFDAEDLPSTVQAHTPSALSAASTAAACSRRRP